MNLDDLALKMAQKTVESMDMDTLMEYAISALYDHYSTCDAQSLLEEAKEVFGEDFKVTDEEAA